MQESVGWAQSGEKLSYCCSSCCCYWQREDSDSDRLGTVLVMQLAVMGHYYHGSQGGKKWRDQDGPKWDTDRQTRRRQRQRQRQRQETQLSKVRAASALFLPTCAFRYVLSHQPVKASLFLLLRQVQVWFVVTASAPLTWGALEPGTMQGMTGRLSNRNPGKVWGARSNKGDDAAMWWPRVWIWIQCDQMVISS